jgi:hypothetical protein
MEMRMNEEALKLLDQYIEAALAMKAIDWSDADGGGQTMMEVIHESINWAMNVRDHSKEPEPEPEPPTTGERMKEEFHPIFARERAGHVALLGIVIAALEAGDVAKALQRLRDWRDGIRAIDRRAP